MRWPRTSAESPRQLEAEDPSPINRATPELWVGSLRDLVERVVGIAPLKQLVNWGRIYSLWPVHLMTACCGAELGAMMSGRYDPERYGMQAAVGAMRQSDLLIIEGTVTKKMLKRVKVVWEQMPNPKYCIAMGDCACSGGLFHDSYSIINELEKAIPIDVFVPGCPPRPEALLNAVIKLREKIRHEEVYARS
jgi:NADH-quinone oxidoreductase subunit B